MTVIGKLFDPDADLAIDSHYRPHWSQAGAIVFVTFRMKDSIPKKVLRKWHADKIQWLAQRGIVFEGNFSEATSKLSARDAEAFRKTFNRQREMQLDECHVSSVLRAPKLAKIGRLTAAL